MKLLLILLLPLFLHSEERLAITREKETTKEYKNGEFNIFGWVNIPDTLTIYWNNCPIYSRRLSGEIDENIKFYMYREGKFMFKLNNYKNNKIVGIIRKL